MIDESSRGRPATKQEQTPPRMMDEEHGPSLPSAPPPPASPTVVAVGDDGSADKACAEESNDAQQELQQHVHVTNELRVHHDPKTTSHDAENSGKAAGDLEAKNPFDADGAAGVSSSRGRGAPDPDTEAGESAHNNEKEDEDERSPSPPPQAPPPPQQPSPFPKFEPYRPQSDAAVADELDDDEWAAFEDGFQDEDSLGMPGLGVAGNASAAAAPAGNAQLPLMPPAKTTAAPAALSSTPGAPSVLTLEDIEICQRLDEEFDRALEEREIGWTARYNSVRQCACLSLTFMGSYLVLGTWYFFRHTDWALNDTLLFTIYTITTIGLGNHDIPNTANVQTFIIFFIFVGIATLTIMVAQVYQCVVLETTRAQYSRDRAELSRHRQQQSSHLGGGTAGAGSRVSSAHGGSTDEPWAVDFDTVAEHTGSCGERILRNLDRTKHFLRNTELGRGLSVLLPFVGLILIGAAVVGPIEGWTVTESIYFSVVALTTTGYGDYFPTKSASTWFCIFWLPFSVGFMSLYLGGVAHFYIQLSNSNIQRLERQMRRRIRRAKEWAEKERRQASARVEAANAAIKKKQMQALEAENGGGDGDSGSGGADDDAVKASVSPPRKPKNRDDFFQTLPSGDMYEEDGVSASVGVMGKQNLRSESRGESFCAKRRERIIGDASRSEEMQNGGGAGAGANDDLEGGSSRPRGTTMSTMRDIIDTVHGHISSHGAGATPFSGGTLASIISGNVQVKVAPESDLMSIGSRKKVSERKPSFALRVLTQERLAEIIAIEVAGYQTSVNIQENTMSITIDRLNPVLDKWTIPRRARKAFRTVAFESLYFVGERGLIIRGADALYDLTPFEFHRLFAPLLAAMGDADTMEGWLDNTNVLAEVDLKKNYGLMSVSPVKRPAFSERFAAVQERQHHNIARDASTKLKKATFRRKVPGNALSK